jgi:hypothetical protein
MVTRLATLAFRFMSAWRLSTSSLGMSQLFGLYERVEWGVYVWTYSIRPTES